MVIWGVFSVLTLRLAQTLVTSCWSASVSLCSLKPDDVTSFCLRCHWFLESRFVDLILIAEHKKRTNEAERRGWREMQRDLHWKCEFGSEGVKGGWWDEAGKVIVSAARFWERKTKLWHPINISKLRSVWNWIPLDILKNDQRNVCYALKVIATWQYEIKIYWF